MDIRNAGMIAIAMAILLFGNIRMASMRRIQHENIDRVRREDVVLSVRCAGTLSAKNISIVRAAVNARVIRKYVSEGELVKEGQLLMELDGSDIVKILRSNKEEEQNTAREHTKARKEVQVQKNLFKYGAVSKKNIEDSEAALEKAATAARNAVKNLSDTRKLLGKTRIFSPMNGLVIRDFLKSENAVQQNKDIFMVGTLDAFQADVGVDEIDVARVALGQKAELRVEAFPDTLLIGWVMSIAPSADRTSFAKVNVKIDIQNPQRLILKPNLSVDAKIITGRLSSVLTIPVSAVSRRDGESWVSTVGLIGRTLQKDVKLGSGNDERVVVLSGVREGEVVLLAK